MADYLIIQLVYPGAYLGSWKPWRHCGVIRCIFCWYAWFSSILVEVRIYRWLGLEFRVSVGAALVFTNNCHWWSPIDYTPPSRNPSANFRKISCGLRYGMYNVVAAKHYKLSKVKKPIGTYCLPQTIRSRAIGHLRIPYISWQYDNEKRQPTTGCDKS